MEASQRRGHNAAIGIYHYPKNYSYYSQTTKTTKQSYHQLPPYSADAAAAAIAIVSTVSCCCRAAAADSNAILARLAYLVQQQAWLKIDDYVVQCESRTNKREKHFAHFTTNQSFLLPTSWLVPLVPHYWLLLLPLCHKPVGVANMILSVTSVLKLQVSALISNCLSK